MAQLTLYGDLERYIGPNRTKLDVENGAGSIDGMENEEAAEMRVFGTCTPAMHADYSQLFPAPDLSLQQDALY